MSGIKVHIFGVSGSGKTYLAKRLAAIFEIDHYDLDDFFFECKYCKSRTAKERKKLFKETIRKDNWIVEGVYDEWVEDSIKKCNLLIWVDAPLSVIVWRILKRYLKSKDENSSLIETLKLLKMVLHYKLKDDLETYRRSGKEVLESNGQFIYLKNKKEVAKFLKKRKKEMKFGD